MCDCPNVMAAFRRVRRCRPFTSGLRPRDRPSGCGNRRWWPPVPAPPPPTPGTRHQFLDRRALLRGRPRHRLDGGRDLLRRGAHLLRRRAGLLHDGRRVRDRQGHLLRGVRIASAAREDVLHPRRHALTGRLDLFQRPPRLPGARRAAGHIRRAGLHRRHGLLRARLHLGDQAADLLCRPRRPLGQLAHLVGDHREAAARLAGPRRLDGGVQRQQVGLLGDLVNGLHDAADLARRSPSAWTTCALLRDGLVNVVHADRAQGDGLGRPRRRPRWPPRWPAAAFGVPGDAGDRRPPAAEPLRALAQCRAWLALPCATSPAPPRRLLGRQSDLVHGRRDLFGGRAHLLGRPRQGVGRRADVGGRLLELADQGAETGWEVRKEAMVPWTCSSMALNVRAIGPNSSRSADSSGSVPVAISAVRSPVPSPDGGAQVGDADGCSVSMPSRHLGQRPGHERVIVAARCNAPTTTDRSRVRGPGRPRRSGAACWRCLPRVSFQATIVSSPSVMSRTGPASARSAVAARPWRLGAAEGREPPVVAA